MFSKQDKSNKKRRNSPCDRHQKQYDKSIDESLRQNHAS